MFIVTELIFEKELVYSLEQLQNVFSELANLHGEDAEVSMNGTTVESMNKMVIRSEVGPSNG